MTTIAHLPAHITWIFLLTVAVTFLLFLKATKTKTGTLLLFVTWLLITGILAYKGFFLETHTLPPRLAFAVGPAILLIVLLFLTKMGRQYIDQLDIRILTLLHTIRVPVELVLYWLSLNKVIPELMTFEGRNFDIIAGLTAPLVYALCFKANKIARKNLLITWNILSLLLLLNIVINGILSAPTPFQRFAFEQPNIALLHFPFAWLPAFIVPLVLLSHLVVIRSWIQRNKL